MTNPRCRHGSEVNPVHILDIETTMWRHTSHTRFNFHLIVVSVRLINILVNINWLKNVIRRHLSDSNIILYANPEMDFLILSICMNRNYSRTSLV